jgi:hypothetical protein
MKTGSWIMLVCMVHMPAFAAGSDVQSATVAKYLVHSAFADLSAPVPGQRHALADTQVRISPFARAIGQAKKKGVIEAGLEGYTEVLIQCQKAQSTVLTTPFMRSDSQQAHCYRF